MISQIQAESAGVDVLVNNVVLALPGQLLTAARKLIQSMSQVNILAVCICSREAVNQMQEKGTDDEQVI